VKSSRIFSCRKNAHLAVVAELAHHRHLGAGLGIGVREDDKRRMATQLQAKALHLVGRALHQLLAHLGGTGEGNLAADGVFQKFLRHLAPGADHQVRHPGGQAGIDQALKHLDEAERRLCGRSADDGATGGQGRGDLARLQGDGEIPGADCPHHAYRVLHRQVAATGLPVWDDLAVGALAFLCKPLEGVR